MTLYSTEPIGRDEAVRRGQGAGGTGRLLIFVAILAGIAGVVALMFVVGDSAAKPAWIALIICAAITGVFGYGANVQMAKMRYRITVALAPLRLVAEYIAFGVVFAGVGIGFDAAGIGDHPMAKIMRGLLFVGVVGVTTWHLQSATLFMGWFHNVIVRRRHISWDAVDALVFASGTKPGTVEIGVRLRPAIAIEPMPVRSGERFTDLPVRVVVAASKFDLDKLHWSVNQSGRTDITIVERTAMGERIVRQSNARAGWTPTYPFR